MTVFFTPAVFGTAFVAFFAALFSLKERDVEPDVANGVQSEPHKTRQEAGWLAGSVFFAIAVVVAADSGVLEVVVSPILDSVRPGKIRPESTAVPVLLALISVVSMGCDFHFASVAPHSASGVFTDNLTVSKRAGNEASHSSSGWLSTKRLKSVGVGTAAVMHHNE